MNPYKVLGVPPTASQDEIRRAYKKAIFRAHPDRGGDILEATLLNQAYDILVSPHRRLRYDQTRQTKVDTKESIARDKLTAMFLAWLGAPETDFEDPIRAINTQLNTELAKLERTLRDGRSSIERGQKRLKRLHSKLPWLHDRLENEIEKVEGRCGQVQESIEAIELAKRLLQDFTFEPPSPSDPPQEFNKFLTENFLLKGNPP